MTPTRSDLVALALVMLGSAGCTTSPSRLPAPGSDSRRPAATVQADTTISAAEAARILRHAALVRALSRSPEQEHTQMARELRALWADVAGRPEEDALLDLIDRHLLARDATDRDSTTTDLRIDVVHAWLDRGNRERAAAQAEIVRHNQSMTSPEEEAELIVALGHPRLEEELAERLQPENAAVARALASARWGDASAAESAFAALDSEDRCRVAATLGARRRREGSPDAARWRAAAEVALGESEADEEGLRRCVVELGAEAQRAGDREGAARAYGRYADADLSRACMLLYDVAEDVDASLLDGPLLQVDRLLGERSSPRNVCAATAGGLAARRGDRAMAARMWTRALAEQNRWDGDRGYDRAWMTSVRLGRHDALAPHELWRDAFRPLALARIFDEQPDTRVDRYRLLRASTKDPDDHRWDPPGDGDDADGGAEP